MSRTDQVYPKSRPDLVIESTGGRNLGRCYSASYFRVTSTRALDKKTLEALSATGFLGYGQEFYCLYVDHEGKKVPVPQELDWRAKAALVPTGLDIVHLTEVDYETRAVIRVVEGPKPTTQPYFIYECESRVDSGD